MAVEFGICTRSDLPPEMCGCEDHRNSRGFAKGYEKDTTGVTIHHTFRATFDSKCAFDKTHPILTGDVVAKMMGRDGADMGYWCLQCAEALT